MKLKNYLSKNHFDDFILNFIESNKDILFFIIISLLALGVRYGFRTVESGDFIGCLKPWYEEFQKNGMIDGIKNSSANYNVTYLYIMASFIYMPFNCLTLIKGVSIIFDFILAIGGALIVKNICNGDKNLKFKVIITYSFIILCPTVILNSSAWAQCDSIYVSFLVFSIYFILKKKYPIGFVLYGIAFAFKLQAIFVLPLYIILYVKNKEFSIINFILIPITNLILFIPAWIMGRNISDFWNIYFSQTQQYKKLVLNFPNIYNFMLDKYEIFYKPGIIISLAAIGIFLFIIMSRDINIDNKKIIEITLILLLLETYFLPAMHDRYLFFGDILSIIYVIMKKNKNYIVPIGIIITSFNSYLKYLFKVKIMPVEIASAILLVVMIVVINDFFKNNTNNECINK